MNRHALPWLRSWPCLVALMALALLGQPRASHAAENAITEKRIALVIGNSAYSAVPVLPNPRRDAETVARTLKQVGFSRVDLATDLSRIDMTEALRQFARRAQDADWAIVYFAGHGVEMAGSNYLIPVDAHLAADSDVEFEAVPLRQVLSTVAAARRLRIVILDACRDNPFLNQMRRSLASRAIQHGLGRIEPEAGILVAYSAKDGEFALDGEAASPFASALVSNMQTPGLEVGRLFRRVRSDVLRLTHNAQEPYTYGSLPDQDFYFVKPEATETVMAEKPASNLPVKENMAAEKATAVPTAPPSPPRVDQDKAPAKVASLENTSVPEKPEPDLNRSLQSELKRVGCYPGTVDDQWSEPARLALRKFARYANLDHLGDQPDKSTLLLLRAKTDPVCPSVNHAAKPNKPAQTAKSAEAPRAHPSQRCFMAQGRQFCE